MEDKRDANKEKMRADAVIRFKKWREANKDRYNEQQRQYREKNKERINEYQRLRRSKLKNNSIENKTDF